MEKETKTFTRRLLAELKKIREALADGPGKNYKTTIDTQNNASQEDDHIPGRPIPILTSKPDPPVHNTDKAKEEGGEPAPRWKSAVLFLKTIPWWKTLEGVGLFSAIFIAVITCMQWRDLRHNFEVDERAWLYFRVPHQFTIQVGLPISIPIDRVNVGKTPAKTVSGTIAVRMLTKGVLPDFLYQPNTYTSTEIGLLIPNLSEPMDIQAVRAGPGNMKEPIILTETAWREFQEGRSYVVAYGRITYRDIFGRNHWVTFCAQTMITPRIEMLQAQKCAAYNNSDDN